MVKFLFVLGGMTLCLPCLAWADLGLLFAPPTSVEISTIAQNWSSRTPNGTDFSIERTAEASGFQIARVSFRFEGLKQYAMLRYPLHYTPNGTYPILMLHHGGTQGFYYTFGLDFDEDYPTDCLAEECLVLVPTYRGEGFASGDVLGNAFSEGQVSVWDRDCDDAMALMTAALEALPEADPSRLYCWGRSRGAGVVYHMALRDSRLRRSEAFFGPTDFFQDQIRLDVQATLDGGPLPTNTLSSKVWQYIVNPWTSGEMSLEEARLLMTAWSSKYFAHQGASLQIHHGEADTNIPVIHAESMAQAMIISGATAPEFELFTYPGGVHNLDGLPGYESRVEEYLCLPDELSRIPGPVLDSTLEAWPNPFTQRVLIHDVGTSGNPQEKATGEKAMVNIYDMRGRLVETLALPHSGAALWDGTDVHGRPAGAGIYLMNQTGSTGPPLKVLLLR